MKGLIKYNSSFRHIWDGLVVVFTILSIFIITYQAFFSREISALGNVLIYLIDIFFIASMWVFSRTTFKRFGSEVLDPLRIKKRFMKRSFIWDLLGIIPFELLGLALLDTQEGISLFLMLRLSRLIRIRYIFLIFKKWENESWFNSASIRILRLLTLVIVSSHLVACSWFYSSYAEGYQQNSWVVRENLVEKSAPAQYLRSIYWSITSMTTVGYGDITPKRNVEYIISMIVMGIGASSYAFIIGNIASLFSNIDISKSRHQNKIDSVFHFLKARSVEPELIEKVNSYYEYIWEKRRGLNESDLFNDLPTSLRLDLLKDLMAEQLDKVPLFKYSNELIRNELLKSLTLEIFSPGSTIVNSGEPGNAIFFISKGSVSVLNTEQDKKAELHAGDYFGDLSLILKESRSGTVRCNEFSEVFVLSEYHFLRIKNDYKEFTETLKDVSKNRSEKALSLLLNDIIL